MKMDYGRIFIIGEAGINHNGDLKKACRLVDIAREAGVDAVKFQTFRPGECTGRFAVKVNYLKATSDKTETRYGMTNRLALPFSDFLKIKRYADKAGVLFLTTPDGKESLDYANDVLKVPIIKISSTEVTNLRFLEQVAKKKKPIIFSTGLSTLKEVKTALAVMRRYNDDITVLHCVSEYPAPPEEVNLRAMVTMKNVFKVKVGYSDHTLGNEAAVAAVVLGACVIEKHFTIDRSLPGPDQRASISPSGLKELVVSIRKTEQILGDGIKRPSKSELKNIDGIRRSIVAAKALKAGTVLCKDNIACKRPGYGIHPYDYEKVIGMKLNRDLKEDEPLRWEYLR